VGFLRLGEFCLGMMLDILMECWEVSCFCCAVAVLLFGSYPAVTSPESHPTWILLL
jgi:hypothetical protein